VADGCAKDRTDWLQLRPQRPRRLGRTSWWSATCGQRIRRGGVVAAAAGARARGAAAEAVTCCADSAASRRSGACGGDGGDGDLCPVNSVRSSARGRRTSLICHRDCGPGWNGDGDGDDDRLSRDDETTEAVAAVAVATVVVGRPWASSTTKWANRQTTECAQCGPVRGSTITRYSESD